MFQWDSTYLCTTYFYLSNTLNFDFRAATQTTFPNTFVKALLCGKYNQIEETAFLHNKDLQVPTPRKIFGAEQKSWSEE